MLMVRRKHGRARHWADGPWRAFAAPLGRVGAKLGCVALVQRVLQHRPGWHERIMPTGRARSAAMKAFAEPNERTAAELSSFAPH